jgi:GAF domain-containing protein
VTATAASAAVTAPTAVAVTTAATSVDAAVPPHPAKMDPETSAIPLMREKQPSQPSPARASKPRLAAVRRRAGEDLIGELFETMHDLHFHAGVADGSEFVLGAVESVVPCEGVLIHVFDINKRQFVVVRAKGPGAGQTVLHATPDGDEFFAGVMRRPGSVVIHDTARDGRVLGARWEALGVKPTRALCGPVRLGGRYLGLVEVANPLGDAPFHQTEQNAIDYVCEQFAQFLANRPIVLEADVVLKR